MAFHVGICEGHVTKNSIGNLLRASSQGGLTDRIRVDHLVGLIVVWLNTTPNNNFFM